MASVKARSRNVEKGATHAFKLGALLAWKCASLLHQQSDLVPGHEKHLAESLPCGPQASSARRRVHLSLIVDQVGQVESIEPLEMELFMEHATCPTAANVLREHLKSSFVFCPLTLLSSARCQSFSCSRALACWGDSALVPEGSEHWVALTGRL